jgi:hypothetical protein
MDLMPFVRLAAPRVVDRPDLPPELAAFYTWHEGVGRDCDPDRSVRLHRLDEVTRVGWSGLGLVGGTPSGWEGFAALWIGFGIYFQEVVYVLASPSCPPGSILVIGTDVCGPGGVGPDALESSLVLAASFPAWLTHLERWGWAEPAIATNRGLTEREREEPRDYYLTNNPGMYLGGSEPSS